jgi:glycyl-radical enzyme activating protein
MYRRQVGAYDKPTTADVWDSEASMEFGKDEAIIFDIQGFSVHDGPGGRTLVFFKGCPLRCKWCCNPEGLDLGLSVMYRSSKCKRCHSCVASCPSKAVTVSDESGFIVMDRNICASCTTHECVENCLYQALSLAGRRMTLQQLLHKLERDRRFWGRKGGVTLGGGEVMCQYAFAARLLEECRRSGMHTAIETSGFAPWEHFEKVLKHVNWIFVDLKHIDPKAHMEGTGVSNGLILANIRRMAKLEGHRLLVRIPLIPQFNDDENNIMESAIFLQEAGIGEVNILPFHRLGSSKYDQLFMEYECRELAPPSAEGMKKIQGIFRSHDIACYAGSNTPF